MVKPSDIKAFQKPVEKERAPRKRQWKSRNQPLKGNPELFAMKNQLEKENSK